MATDELEYGEDLPRSVTQRVAAAVVASVFATLVFGTAIVDTAWPVEPKALKGAELQQQRAQRASASIWDGSRARLVEDELRDRSRVRAALLPTYALLKYAYLGEGTSDVLVGRERWLFLENRVHATPLPVRDSAELTANLFCALDRRLTGRGLQLTLIPVPRKAWVARELLPRGVDAQLELDDLLIDGLLARGLRTADLRAAYRERDPSEIYFEADSHWTPVGARLAAELSVRAAGRAKEASRRLGTLVSKQAREGRKVYDLLRAIGARSDAQAARFLGFADYSVQALTFSGAERRWIEEHDAHAEAAQAGTSFSHQQRFFELLAHFSGEVVKNAAAPAQPFLGTTTRLLRGARTHPDLERVYIEFPIAPTFARFSAGEEAYFGPAAGEVFVLAPPGQARLIAPLPKAWRKTREDTVQLLPGRRRPLAQVPAGLFLHDGRGLACVRLRGTLEGGTAELTLQQAGHRLEVTLQEGAVDVVLPLVSATPTSAPVTLSTRSPRSARLKLDELSLVQDSVGPAPIGLEIAEGGLKPASPLELGRRASLLLVLPAAGETRRDLRVRVFSDSGATLERGFPLAKPGAHVLIDLGELEGARLERVELTSGGAPYLSKRAELSVGSPR